MKQEVTVLIVSYNPGGYLREAVFSVLRQTHKNWRLILLDDASTDNSLQGVSELIDDERISLVKNERNIGQALSLNRGLGEIHTEFFLKLDSDDWLHPFAIQSFLHAARGTSQEVALFICNPIRYDQESGEERIIRQAKWGQSYANRYQAIIANLFPFQTFYRTEAVRSFGGWANDGEDAWRYVEDFGVFLRLIENHTFQWIDEALYYWRIHKQSMTSGQQKIAAGVEWHIRDALRRWGDLYEPIFMSTPEGWRMLKALISKTPNWPEY